MSRERALDPDAPSRTPITHHARVCMPAAVRAAEEALLQPRLAIVQAVATAATERLDAVRPLVAFSDRIEALLGPIEKAGRACDRWLADPDLPGEYNIGPRSYELEVVYEEEVEGMPLAVRRKASLAELLARVAGVTGPAPSVEAVFADPREYLLKVQAEARKNLELIAKIIGLLRPDTEVTVNLTASPEWLAIRARMVEVTKAKPELRELMGWVVKGQGAMP